MMKILVVKMSSMGDVIHALPAMTDACKAIPNLEVHWVVEEGFADIVRLHPSVSRVIPVAIRRWRKNWYASLKDKQLANFRRQLQETQYDLIIDSQGLIKSAVVARLARGPVAGFDRHSAREPMACMSYRYRYPVANNLHAIDRQRQLFSVALGYSISNDDTLEVDFGITAKATSARENSRSVVLLHGTTWPSKLWPVDYWRKLAQLITASGYKVLIPAADVHERERAKSIAAELVAAEVLPSMDLASLIAVVADCCAAISVDTGLGHLASALKLPMIALYGATTPALTGIYGAQQQIIVSDHLPCIPCNKRICQFPNDGDSGKIYPPCFGKSTPERVWQALLAQIEADSQ